MPLHISYLLEATNLVQNKGKLLSSKGSLLENTIQLMGKAGLLRLIIQIHDPPHFFITFPHSKKRVTVPKGHKTAQHI